MKNFFIENYQWIIPLIVGGILVPFIILFIQILQKKARNKPANKPNIFITEVWSRHFFNIEIVNTGTEDIIDFQGMIYWMQEGKKEERKLYAFINENEDQLFASPKDCKILRRGEKKIAVNIPHYSDDGQIEVIIKGLGMESKKEFNKTFVVKNKIDGK